VLSCGQVLRAHPGSLVVTVFAGRPEGDPLSAWDRAYFKPGDTPVPTRWAEDDAACAGLGATSKHLEFLDSAYASLPSIAECSMTLLECVDQSSITWWLVPLGFAHPDHDRVREAAMAAIHKRPSLKWVIYEDLPYSLEFPTLRDAALRAARTRFRLEPLILESDSDLSAKERAVRCYASQVVALGEERVSRALSSAECYWQVVL